jgi:MerR family mercuric resistance operon transcriptional regulator
LNEVKLEMLRIGQVAKKGDVGVETVRFYESEGLIELPKRNASGYRQYPESTIMQIQFIRQAKSLGFSLKEIGELIKLKKTPNARCDGVKTAAVGKIADIQKKIDALVRMKEALQPLVAKCRASEPICDCPILNAINE